MVLGDGGRNTLPRQQTARDLARFYDAVADEYDESYYGDSADPCIAFDVEHFERVLARRIAHRRPSSVAELGCGSGHWLRWLAQRDIEGIGIDVSFAMCRAARLSGSTSVQADLSELPVRSGTIDLVLAPYCALDHCTQFEKAFAEIGRITRPGSTAILMVDNGDRFIRRYWNVRLKRVRSIASDPRSDGNWRHEVDGVRLTVFTKMYTIDELRQLLPNWALDFRGLGFFTPLIPSALRRRAPTLTRVLLSCLAPVENLACQYFPGSAALLVVLGTRC